MDRNNKEYYSPEFYLERFKERMERIRRLQDDPEKGRLLLAYYKDKPVEFINDWAITFNPRNVGTDLPVMMPFILFPRQEEMINWLYDCTFVRKRRGVVDKCRDSGATWLGCAFSAWLIVCHSNVFVGWGSRKYELVDKKGEPDCIFEKIRQLLKALPNEIFDYEKDVEDKNGLIINKLNKSSVSGEGGDNIGRGGRKTIYFVDEHAFLDHPEAASASLGLNTDVEIDISTHNGTTTLYYQRCQVYEEDCKFVFEWWENPFHDEKWLNDARTRYSNEGTPWLFEQEVMRNPGGSVPGILIPQKYVSAAIDAHKKLEIAETGQDIISLDVANEGGDLNCAVHRKGILLKDCRSWAEGTTTETANLVIEMCDDLNIYNLRYEAVGVGAGIKGEVKRQNQIRHSLGIPQIDAVGWQPSGEIVDKKLEFAPNTNKKNADMFQNCNGQAAWDLRERFRKTYESVEGIKRWPDDELISIDSNMVELQKLVNELSQPKLRPLDMTNGKIAIEKKPKGTKSPNRFDSVKIAFARLNSKVISGGSWFSTPAPSKMIQAHGVQNAQKIQSGGSYY